jgi:DNA-binding NtrC family response regulator
MKNKNILVIEGNDASRKQISLIVKEIGLDVIEESDGVEALKQVKTEKIDLVIMNIAVRSTNAILLIKTIQKIHRNSEVIVLSETENANLFNLLRKLGVYRIIKTPVHPEELKDAIISGLSSRRIFRLALKRTVSPERARVLIAHDDDSAFENILRICIMEELEIECADTVGIFLGKLENSFYDVLILSNNYLQELLNRMADLDLSTKPIICLIHKTDAEMNVGKKLKTGFPCFFQIVFPFEKEILLASLRKNLLKHKKIKDNIASLSLLDKIRNNFYIARIACKTPIIGIYILGIIFSVIFGFFISDWIGSGKKTQSESSFEVNKIKSITDEKSVQELLQKKRR